MNELDKRIDEALQQQQEVEAASFARLQRQIADLTELFEQIEASSFAHQRGWSADRGQRNEIILIKNGQSVGRWSRGAAGLVFEYDGGTRAPMHAADIGEMLAATTKLIIEPEERNEDGMRQPATGRLATA